MNSEFTTAGYSLAGIAFVLLTLMLLTRSAIRIQDSWLALATACSAIWAFVLAFAGPVLPTDSYLVFAMEILHDAAWLLFLSMFLGGAVVQGPFRALRYIGPACAGLVLLAGTWAHSGVVLGAYLPDLTQTLIFGSLLTSLFVFVGIEQIYRNARPSQRKGLKFLGLGIAGIFAYDTLLYSSAIVAGAINTSLWSVRGIIALMCTPLIGIAVIRGTAWLGGIYMSRRVVFYSTMAFFGAAYLVFFITSGYFVSRLGGGWGDAAKIVALGAALLTLAVLLISDRVRARLHVYISKHFFESKYDYREEWIRLIETLTSADEDLPLRKRAIKSLAQIPDVSSGLLWLLGSDVDEYSCVAGWNERCCQQSIASDHSLVQFLQNTGWVIDLAEYRQHPGRYDNLLVDETLPGQMGKAYIVPLLSDANLLGFVYLSAPRLPQQLNFEDHDLLKTAGKQIASYLAQELSTEQLAESRQFEAYNRLTAYLMHDLKNLMAQQSLVVENAEKHKGNPKFIDDAIATVKGGVDRLRRVIEHIQQRSVNRPHERTELGKVILQAASQCSDRKPLPKALIHEKQIWVRADKERLFMALYHALRNAQEATAPDGQITVELVDQGADCEIVVTDNGAGMDDSFLRERLFRPFDSTKGTTGMGIGAYQMRETIRSMGGHVGVSSEPGSGTRVTIKLRAESA